MMVLVLLDGFSSPKKVPVDFLFFPSSLSTEVQTHVLGGNSPKLDVQTNVWRQCMILDAFGLVCALINRLQTHFLHAGLEFERLYFMQCT